MSARPVCSLAGCDRQRVLDALVDWLVSTDAELDRDAIDDTTRLIEDRLVSSLQVTELLLFIERLRGMPVDVDELRPGVFRDFATIIQTFFPEVQP